MQSARNGATRRILLVQARANPERAGALFEALAPDAIADVAPSAEPLPDPRPYAAVILDGAGQRCTEADAERLAAFVAAGGSLLAIGAAPTDVDAPLARLLGAVAGESRPSGELVVRAAAPESDLLQRLDPEFVVLDAFAPLRPLHADARPLLHVVWTLRDETLALVREHGAGRILVTSVGSNPGALRAPALRALLRRALRPRPAEPARPLGLAVVGYGPYGGMGFLHGSAARQVPGWHFVAACDRSPERLAAAARDFPDLHLYDDAQLLAADDAVDVVVVATPPATHAALTLSLLEAGKHVVCEKPLCLTMDEADLLLARARALERTLTVHQNRRWDPDYLAIRRTLDDGLLGELFNVETFIGGFDHPCRFWHSDRAVSGGAIYDWGSHYLDWTLQLMGGPPASVSATAHKRVWHDVTNADQMRVRLLWDDGREAEFVHSDVAAVRRPKFYLQGTAGTLVGQYRPLVWERVEPSRGYVREESHYAEAPADLTLARYRSGIGIEETRVPLEPPRPLAFHRNLADHLLLGEPLAVTPDSVRPVIAVLEAATRSAACGGQPISLDAPDLSRNGSGPLRVPLGAGNDVDRRGDPLSRGRGSG